MDEMVAKFRLDNLADRIYLEVERGLVEGRHHGTSAEQAQIATLPRGRAV